jgi:hypothetical protein
VGRSAVRRHRTVQRGQPKDNGLRFRVGRVTLG